MPKDAALIHSHLRISSFFKSDFFPFDQKMMMSRSKDRLHSLALKELGKAFSIKWILHISCSFVEHSLFVLRKDLNQLGRSLIGSLPKIKEEKIHPLLEEYQKKISPSFVWDGTTLHLEWEIDETFLALPLIHLLEEIAKKYGFVPLFHEYQKKQQIQTKNLREDQTESGGVISSRQVVQKALFRSFQKHKTLLAFLKDPIFACQKEMVYIHLFHILPDPLFQIGVIQTIVADSLEFFLYQSHLKEELHCETSSHYFHLLKQWIDKKTLRVFEGILTEEQLQKYYEKELHRYVSFVQLEASVILEMFQAHLLLLPQSNLNSPFFDLASFLALEIKTICSQLEELGWEGKAKVCSELLSLKIEELASVTMILNSEELKER